MGCEKRVRESVEGVKGSVGGGSERERRRERNTETLSVGEPGGGVLEVV